jgi:hypothetical protein
MRAFVVFLHPSREMRGLYCFFKIDYSSMKLPFDAGQYCLEASQNKPQSVYLALTTPFCFGMLKGMNKRIVVAL